MRVGVEVGKTMAVHSERKRTTSELGGCLGKLAGDERRWQGALFYTAVGRRDVY